MKSILFVIIVLLSSVSLAASPYMKVQWITDGDTIVLEDQRRIRYIGINTPEVQHGAKKAEHLGEEAKSLNRTLVFEKKVALEYDRETIDQYGRTLAYVFLEDGTFVNGRLIEAGLAYCLPCYSPCKYDSKLLSLQQRAMSQKIGIWKNWKETPANYIGNKRSKRFHLKTCGMGKKIGRRNRVDFSSKWDAFGEGYSPCKMCIGGKK